MHWKSRQMFGGRPSGIVQMMGGGMTPYPTHTMPDGSVMPGAVHGAGYEIGGVIPELFEEGDSDINNALNNLASVSSPEVPDMPASNGMAMPGGDMPGGEMGGGDMTMDQGSGYEKDVMQLKELFKNEIRSYVSQSGTTDLDAYLKQIGSAYRNKLNELKDKYGIQEYDPSEELITEDFLAELSGEPPMIGMQGAGTVFSDEEKIAQQKILTELQINIPLERWLGMPEKERTKFINIYTIMRSNNPMNPTTREPLTRSDLDTGAYDALTQERRENAERMGAAARAGYSSTQSRLLHHDSAKKAGEIAETMAMDKLLAEQLGDEKGILGYLASANTPGRGATGKNQNLPSDVISDLYGLDPDNEVNLDKSYDTLWKEQNKKNALGAANIDEEFLKFVTQYETVPPVYRAQYGAKRKTSIGVEEFVPWFFAMLKAESDRERKEDEKPFNALEESIKLRKQWAAFSKA